MRLITYRSGRGERAGVLSGGVVVDAGDALGDGGASSVRGLLEAGSLADLAAAVRRSRSPSTDVALLPPIPDPEKIVCIGLNYREHAAEGRQEPPPVPTFFAKFRNSLTADGATVALPAASRKVDYEAEVAFVVGRAAKDVGAGEALDHIAGYTLLNDLSARDLQFQTPQWIPGKVFDGAAPCGPAIVTADEVAGRRRDRHRPRPQRRADAGGDHRRSDLPDPRAARPPLDADDPGSRRHRLDRDAGRGRGAREPRVWLKPGDEIVVSSPQLGELHTTIA